ncbi:mitochondrial ribosome-associated GTPase 1-like [Anneissia japonica]|uniref:mitochondrial ribosome-associated GTPase 1-like n=1 Tax=Anneissia japonica TaxID=1529436 RepID=UPI0014254CC2|nr:mitochondrial ribosome-associated GTPase 1-like [Anneissia japonica]
MSQSGRLYRQMFAFGSRDLTHWFPSHMAKGMKKMMAMLKKVDLVIEVHDARIPLAGRNPMLKELLGVRPSLLILNKMDLADLRITRMVVKKLKEEDGVDQVMYTECLTQHSRSAKKIIPKIVEIIESCDRYNRTDEVEYSILCTGIPNVGKSSLINAMRRLHIKKGKGTSIGQMPGVTKSVLHKIRVNERPTVWLYDSPGVLTPKIQHPEVGMKLAVCGTIPDHRVGVDIICDYLLYTLNKQELYSYVEYFELNSPTDDVMEVLYHIADKVNERPTVWLYDSPGVLTPKIQHPEVGMKLAVCGTIPDHRVGVDIICDYLLYTLNKQELYSYVEYFELNSPTDDVMEVLYHIADKYKKTSLLKTFDGSVVRRPNTFAAADIMLHAFRKGKLGRVTMDAT